MTDTTIDGAPVARTPAHLWIVGILSLLWNAFGAYDYLMTRMRDRDYLSGMGMDPDRMLAYIDGFPIWAQFGWGLGVWMALLGSVLLLARSRWAVTAFALSIVGMVLGLGYQMWGPPPPMEMEGAMAIMPWVILLIGVGLLYYAHRQQRSGVLR